MKAQTKITWIKAKHLSVVWRAAQRPFDPKHSQELAEKFDPDLLGTLAVTRPDEHGMHHIIIGQHRHAAFLSLFGEEQMMPCIVLNANDPVRAAQLFLEDSTSQKPLKTVEEFLVAVTAGRKTEIDVNNIVRKAGCRVGGSFQPDIISAVHALVSVYKKHGATVLGLTLRTLQSTWAGDRNALTSALIRGYGEFLARYHVQVDYDRLHGCMTKRKMTPGRLVAEANHELMMRRSIIKNQPRAMASAIFGIYNSGRGKKLEEVSAPKSNDVGAEAKTA